MKNRVLRKTTKTRRLKRWKSSVCDFDSHSKSLMASPNIVSVMIATLTKQTQMENGNVQQLEWRKANRNCLQSMLCIFLSLSLQE